jgi:hypothetical protein
VRSRVFASFVGALAVALIAAGCGSSEPDPLTKAEFTKQGNSICKNSAEEREAKTSEAAKEDKGGSEEEEFETFVADAALPPIQDMTEELAGLGVPKGDEKEVEAMVVAFEVGVEKLEANPRTLSGPAFAKADKLAEDYGLTECKI